MNKMLTKIDSCTCARTRFSIILLDCDTTTTSSKIVDAIAIVPTPHNRRQCSSVMSRRNIANLLFYIEVCFIFRRTI